MLHISTIFLIYSKYFLKVLLDIISKIEISHCNFIIYFLQEYLISCLNFLKKNINTQYKALTDIIVVDFPKKIFRFLIIYNFLSFLYNFRIFCKMFITAQNSVSSINTVYSAANWYEREIWDMFGIFFYNSIDLRRILTDYGFQGYPLKKDFPITGYLELRYDINYRKVLYEPLQLIQEFRNLKFI